MRREAVAQRCWVRGKSRTSVPDGTASLARVVCFADFAKFAEVRGRCSPRGSLGKGLAQACGGTLIASFRDGTPHGVLTTAS